MAQAVRIASGLKMGFKSTVVPPSDFVWPTSFDKKGRSAKKHENPRREEMPIVTAC